MPYKVLKDGATIHKVIGERTSLSKTSDETFLKKKAIVYREGDVIPDEDIASNVINDYENEVGSIRDLIEKIADEEKKSSPSKSKKSGGQKK